MAMDDTDYGMEDESAPSTAQEDMPDDESSEDTDSAAESFTIPISACEGMKPGDTGKFKIEKVLEQEYLCRYMKDKDSEEKDESKEESEAEDEPEMM